MSQNLSKYDLPSNEDGIFEARFESFFAAIDFIESQTLIAERKGIVLRHHMVFIGYAPGIRYSWKVKLF